MNTSRFFVVLLLFSVYGCTFSEQPQQKLPKIGIPTPVKLTPNALSNGTLFGFIACNATSSPNLSQDGFKPVDEINLATGYVRATCKNIDDGEHYFALKFEFNSTKYNNKTFTLATAKKAFTIGPDTKSVAFVESDFIIDDYNDDGDSQSNLVELNAGTDPTNPDATNPKLQAITPPNNAIITDSQAIVIVFDESIDTDPTQWTLSGSLVSASHGGVWSSGSNNNDTLTVSPNTNWPAGTGKTLSFMVKDLAGNPTSGDYNYDVDAIAPTIVSVNLANTATIGQAQEVIIRFSKTMDVNSLSLGGDMASEAANQWSNNQNNNDTLTLSPQTSWSNGSARTLTIDAADLAGNPLNTLSLTFNVDANSANASPSPAGGSTIKANQSITVTYNKNMDITTLALSGSMVPDSKAGVWSSSNGLTNNVLAISPNTAWNNGGQTLIINVNDNLGNPATTLSLSYSVDGTPPTPVPDIASNSVIAKDQAIKFLFDESIDTGATTLGGTLLASTHNDAWTTTNASNDTLTISPTTSWANDAGTITISASDLVGNVSNANFNYTVDATPAGYQVNIPSNTTISGSQAIILVFTESMNTTSASLSGTMASSSNGGIWSTGTNSNNTLTISPLTSWTNGAGQTLTLSISDLYGNQTSFSATYNIDATFPTATPNPLSDSTINDTQAITVTFSKAMDVASLTLTGTMASNSNGGVWSGGDTLLTISPTTTWGGGAQTLTINALDLIGNPITELILSYSVDNIPAIATPKLPSDSVFSLNQAIEINFNEAMDPASLAKSGSMAAASNNGAWSTTVEANDTVIFSPNTQWIEAENQSFNISVKDLAGNTTTLALTYEADTYNFAFVTSTSGIGNLVDWPEAASKTGLAAGDQICQTIATNAGFKGTFVAWLSDDTNDAYCRVHRLGGLVANNCDQTYLPDFAGPWVRTDGYPFSAKIGPLTSQNQIYTPLRFDETGTAVPYAQPLYFYAGTGYNGVGFTGNNCNNWSFDPSGTTIPGTAFGSPYNTGRWSGNTFTGCTTVQRLACFESGAGIPLPQLSNFPATGKKVFVTSTQGYGDLSTWSDAGGTTGITAGDTICRARATAAGLANAANYKAWLSTDGVPAPSRLVSDGPFVRMDGVLIANNKADLLDGEIFTGISVDEFGNYTSHVAWTGTDNSGNAATDNCSNWTANTDPVSGATLYGVDGNATATLSTHSWSDDYPPSPCNSILTHLYCFED